MDTSSNQPSTSSGIKSEVKEEFKTPEKLSHTESFKKKVTRIKKQLSIPRSIRRTTRRIPQSQRLIEEFDITLNLSDYIKEYGVIHCEELLKYNRLARRINEIYSKTNRQKEFLRDYHLAISLIAKHPFLVDNMPITPRDTPDISGHPSDPRIQQQPMPGPSTAPSGTAYPTDSNIPRGQSDINVNPGVQIRRQSAQPDPSTQLRETRA